VLLPRLEGADLLGARGLALAGGVVTLLGVVFFFALAASNGWIGPIERVLLGAIASALVFAAGVFAHARHGTLQWRLPLPAPESPAGTRRCSSPQPGTS
jgi:hypothetical protein